MSKFQIEVAASVVKDTNVESVKDDARFIQRIIDEMFGENGNYFVKVFDYENSKNVSLKQYEKPTIFTGRQDSEGIIQVMVRNLVKAGFVREEASASVPEITEPSMNLSAENHYTVNYGNLHDSLIPFAINEETFAVEFKDTLSDILMNNAAGGSGFMKKAKQAQKKA